MPLIFQNHKVGTLQSDLDRAKAQIMFAKMESDQPSNPGTPKSREAPTSVADKPAESSQLLQPRMTRYIII